MSGNNIKISPVLRQCIVTASVGCSVISSIGCTMGFPGILLPQLQQPRSAIPVTEDQASWIASAETLPMFLGNCLVPVLMSLKGRRPAHFAVIVVTVLSWATIIVATSFWALIIGRILQGAAAGMMMPLRSILVSECSSPRYRGLFLTIVSLAQILGIMLVHLIGTLLSYKMTAFISMSFSIIGFILTIYTPETPSWLASNGQYEGCRKSFMRLRKQEEITELEKMLSTERSKETNQNKLRDTIVFAKKKEFYKPIILVCAVLSMVNFTNATLLVVYPISVLSALMGPAAHTSTWMVVLDVQSIIFSIIAVFVIHKYKRRTLLFVSGGFCVGFQIAITAYAYIKTKDWLPFDSEWIPGVLVSAQMICLYVGLMPLGPVIAGEVFPLKCRSYAESFSLLSIYLTAFLVVKVFPDLILSVGLHGTYGLFTVCIVACLVVAWVLMPETSGKTLQQIEELFRSDVEADVKEMEVLNKTENDV